MAGKYDRKDHLHQKAKSEGYRSRASYKLIELDSKHRLLKPGGKVLDLGAWPGGWLQVAAKKVGKSGLVVGVDLVEIEELSYSQVVTITGDIRDDEVIAQVLKLSQGGFDFVMSDMSAKLTGIRDVDNLASVGLVEMALYMAQMTLLPGGNFVAKVFKSNEAEQFVKNSRALFNKVIRAELSSSRKTSNEYYVVGLGYKGEEID